MYFTIQEFVIGSKCCIVCRLPHLRPNVSDGEGVNKEHMLIVLFLSQTVPTASELSTSEFTTTISHFLAPLCEKNKRNNEILR